MSICPKNKSSKARRDSRRANWKMSVPSLSKCSKCGALVMPHRVCKACGAYNKKEVVKGSVIINCNHQKRDSSESFFVPFHTTERLSDKKLYFLKNYGTILRCIMVSVQLE